MNHPSLRALQRTLMCVPRYQEHHRDEIMGLVQFSQIPNVVFVPKEKQRRGEAVMKNEKNDFTEPCCQNVTKVCFSEGESCSAHDGCYWFGLGKNCCQRILLSSELLPRLHMARKTEG